MPPDWLDTLRFLRDCRILAGMSQAEVAKAVGVGRVTVTNWESGTFYPSLPKFFRWLEAVEVAVTLTPVEDL